MFKATRIEQIALDLYEAGVIDMFKGINGSNPMSLSGASTSKLWLKAFDNPEHGGEDDTHGQLLAYVSGDSTDENNWSELTPALFATHLVGLIDEDLTAIAGLAKTDGNVIVGNGTTWVAESGATARASLGVTIGTDVQAYDGDLAAIAALSPSNDDVIQRKAGAWSNRTMAQLIADLAALGTTFQPLDSDLTSWAGVTRASGFDTFAATPSSANLKSLVTDETGSGGALVFATGPTIASPAITTSPTAAGSTWTDLGAVTTADINGGTIDGTVIGGSSAAAATFTTATVGNAGLVVGASTPFSDSAGTLTLQNVDALDATTESTIEAAIDTLANLTSVQGRAVTLADAGANAIFGWDDTAGAYENLTAAEATATLNAFTGDSGSGGVKGLVPAPAAGDAAAGKFLKADGTFVAPSGTTPTSVGVHNGKITESNAASAATFALKTLAGSNPSAGDPVTLITPDGSSLSITASLSITINSGAEMGFVASTAARLWFALVNDGGTPRIAVRNCRSGVVVVGFPSSGVLSSTAMGTGADSALVSYTDSAVTDKPYVVLAFADYDSGLGTPGTWGSSPSRIRLAAGVRPGATAQSLSAPTGASSTGATALPSDDTIPQNTEGNQFMTSSITPMAAQNILEVTAFAQVANSDTAAAETMALFQDSTANALAASTYQSPSAHYLFQLLLKHRVLAGGVSSTTFNIRIGANAGTTTFNGQAGSRLMGGVDNSFLNIEEIVG